MSVTVYGPTGSGLITAYTAPKGRTVTVETLTFTVAAGVAAGTHRVRVQMVDTAGQPIATLDDLNTSAASQTTIYTYGLGLNASACATANGWAVTDALPFTQISDEAYVTVEAITDNGVEISGDAISAVVLQVDDQQAQAFELQPILNMPSAAVA